MSITTRFASRYNALDFFYGGPVDVCPAAIQIGSGNTATGAQSITANAYYTVDQGSYVIAPFNTNAPIIVGIGANAETVTPSAVGTAGPSTTGPGTSNSSISITATFSNLHGPSEPISSGTCGLQEAINIASANGGGEVVVSPRWFAAGGTVAMIQAAIQPNTSASPAAVVRIVDTLNLRAYMYSPNSVTVVSAPSAATSSTVASTTATGTWSAATYHVLFTYVTADGGESLASSDYSFTATASKAIGGTGPAASTGAVGYRVYIGTNATTACYALTVNSTNGTVIQCGAITAFKIGTSFSQAAVTTSATALPPLVQSTAFPCGYQPVADPALQQPFSAMQGPFAATSTVTAGTAIEWAKVQLPAGFLNFIGRTLRITITGNYTPVSTATVIITVAVGSLYTGTETTIYTVTTPASSGTTNSVIETQLLFRTAVTGASGKVRCHGFNIIGLATGTAGLGAASLDTTTADSSTVDLTGQNYIRVTINSGTANLTTSQCDMFLVETLA